PPRRKARSGRLSAGRFAGRSRTEDRLAPPSEHRRRRPGGRPGALIEPVLGGLAPFLAGLAVLDAGQALAFERFPPAICHPAHAGRYGRRVQPDATSTEKVLYSRVLTEYCRADPAQAAAS